MSDAAIGFHRSDIHTPVNFLPENYTFVGCFHNTYSFKGGRFNSTRDQLLAKLELNHRPNGPGVSNCDHCGAAIAFVGVFQHRDGDYIAVGSTCAENRFPLSNADFQRLRKEHRLSRGRDLRAAEFEQYKVDHPEVDWALADALAATTAQAASTSANFRVRSILFNGGKYGSLTDAQLRYLGVLITPVPAPVAQLRYPVDPDQAKAQTFLKAYSGSNGFLNSLKSQVEDGRTLSPRQLECALRNVAEAEAPQVPKVDNSRLPVGIYVDAAGLIFKVQGNQAFKSAAKRQAKDSTAPDPYSVGFVYAKVWGQSDGTRLPIQEVGDLSLHQLWIYERGLIHNLVVDHRMTLDEARHFGELYSQCVNCGRTLTDKNSIDKAIGPVCIRQFTNWGHQELDHNHA